MPHTGSLARCADSGPSAWSRRAVAATSASFGCDAAGRYMGIPGRESHARLRASGAGVKAMRPTERSPSRSGAVRAFGTAPATERAVRGPLAEDGSVAPREPYAPKSRARSGRIAGASGQRLDAGGAAGGCAKRLSISRLWSQRLRWDPAGILGVHQPCLGRQSMSVARVTEIISASDQSFEHAVQEGVQRA